MEVTALKMKKELPFVSVITVNYNGKHLLDDLFDSLLQMDYPQNKLEIIMVDNCSVDGSIDFIKERYPKVKIIQNDANNYCRANNLGVETSSGKYVAMLNNDTKVEKNWLIELIRALCMNKKAGVAGSKILFMNGKIQSAGHASFPNYYWGDKGLLEEDKQQYDDMRYVESISNCSALYSRKALEEVGAFDEDFVMYMEDVDIAFRLKAKGWGILYVPKSIVYHRLHGSQQDPLERKFYIERNRLLFLAKHLPYKLPEAICGFGDITRLKYMDLDKVLIAVFDKLIKHQSLGDIKKILPPLEKSICVLSEYRQHSFSIELEEKTQSIQKEISRREDLLRVKDEELISRDHQLKAQQEAIRVKDEELISRDHQLKAQQEAIRVKDEELKLKDRIIADNNQEMYKVYHSETYRFFVKPIIWPLLTFVKRIRRFLNYFNHFNFFRLRKKIKSVIIAQFYSTSAEAHSKQKNEYFLKLYNREFKTKRVKITLDIWPNSNQSHPDRHFAYFATETTLNPRKTNFIKFDYDWDMKISLSCDDKEVQVIDFWRGVLNNSCLYTIIAIVYDFESGTTDKLAIVQRYIKE